MNVMRRVEIWLCLAVAAVVCVVPLFNKVPTIGAQPPPPVTDKESKAIDAWRTNEYRQSELLLRELWDERVRVNDPHYDQRLELYLTELASLYRSWQRFDEAEAIYQNLIDYTHQRTPLNYSALARQYNGLATVQYMQACTFKTKSERERLLKVADQSYEEAYSIASEHVANHSSLLSIILTNRANLYWELGQRQQARAMEDDAQKLGMSFFGLERSPLNGDKPL